MPGCDGAETAERSYPMPEARGSSREDLLGTGREEQPHLQGVQESLEELFHVHGQKGRR